MKVMTLRCAVFLFAAAALFASCKNASAPADKTRADSTDKFADNIRKTDFQSPEDERKSFHLPPDFEITLFASEPDISKPINMEFDERGRLWVTTTIEYPQPAAPGRGRDKIVICEDTDGDGKADKFTPFVDSLNIPIGITTMNRGAIAYSIPNVYRFTDTNGDDKADETKKLLGPFEFADTHGMVNNLIRGYDGWIYACHGYANNSTVAGADGDSIQMNSGNTFRFREDGSRVEVATKGRVNPFGYAYDDYGYLYSLDCHTKPIYQLIDKAQYPAQGVKEPPTGWAPIMMNYEFGSTANSGLVYYTGNQFPPAYQQNFYSGNVVTSRINRNTMSLYGSSPESKREEDFLISDDPWFRPVDIKTAPDGSMYIADFYNRIIGHYEVPKDDPGRDKTSGRIWKITYKGKDAGKAFAMKDWSKATLAELITSLQHPQLNTRMMLANIIVDKFANQAIAPVKEMMSASGVDNKSFIQGLWILYRLNALPDDLLQKALKSNQAMVQVHGLRVLAAQKTLSPAYRKSALDALGSSNPQVKRMAAVTLGNFPDFATLQPLVALDMATDERDSHLKYTTVLSIKEHLNNTAILQKVMKQSWSEPELAVLMAVLPEVPTKAAALYALEYLKTHSASGKKLSDQLQFIARHIEPAQMAQLIPIAKKNAGTNIDGEYHYYDAIRQGVAQKGDPVAAPLRQWGESLAGRFLANIADSTQRQINATRIAVDYKDAALEPALKKLLVTKSVAPAARIAAADALMTLSPQRNLPVLTGIYQDTKEPDDLREKLSSTIGQVQTPAVFSMLQQSLKSAPRGLQVNVSKILSGSSESVNYLLNALKNKDIEPDILDEFWVKETLGANITPDQRKVLGTLTAGKMGAENRKDIIMARLTSYDPGSVSIDTGRQIFLKNCSMCHAIDNVGGNIGPHLSGIGTWGVSALATKILDPNSSISEAYRLYTLNLKNGKSMSGLYRRDEGEVEVYADLTGTEFSVAKADMKEKIAAKRTLMPDNFRNTIAKKDFDALLKYLNSIKEKK